jgi:hypothetical protein
LVKNPTQSQKRPDYWVAWLLGGVGILLTIGSYFLEEVWLVLPFWIVSAVLLCWAVIIGIPLNLAQRLMICFAIITLLVALGGHFRERNIEAGLHKLEGTLLAGDEPDPLAGCVPKGAIQVRYGSNVSWTDKKEFNLLAFRDIPLITVRYNQWNLLIAKASTISIKLLDSYDVDGTNITHIDDDNYWVNPLSRIHRKDTHSLTVYGRRGDEVLDIVYRNPSTIRLRGIIRYQQLLLAEITENKISVPGVGATLSEMCLGRAHTMIQF